MRSKKSERNPAIGDRVRVFVDISMADEPAIVSRLAGDGLVDVHVWPDSAERTALSSIAWCADEGGAVAHGASSCFPDGERVE